MLPNIMSLHFYDRLLEKPTYNTKKTLPYTRPFRIRTRYLESADQRSTNTAILDYGKESHYTAEISHSEHEQGMLTRCMIPAEWIYFKPLSNW